MKQIKTTGVIFILIGTIFTIVFSTILINQITFQKTAEKGIAVITNIEEYYSTDSDGNRTTNHDVYIEYTVNQEQYSAELNEYVSGWRVGKEIEIYYDPNNPSHVQTGASTMMLFFFAPFCLLFVGIGLFLLLGNSKGKRKKMMETGTQITVTINQVFRNTSFQVNGQSPFVIECSWVNPTTGITCIMKSENLWVNPQPIIEQKGITALNAYIDMNNPKKYYIDVENIKNSVQVL